MGQSREDYKWGPACLNCHQNYIYIKMWNNKAKGGKNKKKVKEIGRAHV